MRKRIFFKLIVEELLQIVLLYNLAVEANENRAQEANYREKFNNVTAGSYATKAEKNEAEFAKEYATASEIVKSAISSMIAAKNLKYFRLPTAA